MKPPLFDWPSRHRLHLLLPMVLVLAALLHAAVFFLFSIAYPPAVPDTSSPAKVFFLPVGSAVRQQIEGLLHSDDPALFAPGKGLPQPPPPFVAEHVPDFETRRLPLEAMPPLAAPQTPKTTPRGPVEMPRTDFPARPSAGMPSRVHLPPSIAGRLESLRIPDFDASTATPDSPSVFLVGILPGGMAGHVVPQESSGDRALDAAATRALLEAVFKPSEEEETTWGFVEFHWGTADTGTTNL
jgi:hypothetical protein